MKLIPRSMRPSFFDEWPEIWSLYGDEGKGTGVFAPRVDIKESDGHYEVTADLPGVKKDDISVTLENGVLTIAAETEKVDEEKKDDRVIRRERQYGKFMRSFTVGDIDESKITAKFEDGVLRLTTPKEDSAAAESRRIEVH